MSRYAPQQHGRRAALKPSLPRMNMSSSMALLAAVLFAILGFASAGLQCTGGVPVEGGSACLCTADKTLLSWTPVNNVLTCADTPFTQGYGTVLAPYNYYTRARSDVINMICAHTGFLCGLACADIILLARLVCIFSLARARSDERMHACTRTGIDRQYALLCTSGVRLLRESDRPSDERARSYTRVVEPHFFSNHPPFSNALLLRAVAPRTRALLSPDLFSIPRCAPLREQSPRKHARPFSPD